MENQVTLSIKNLVAKYKTHDELVHAVNGIDLEIGKGKALGLVGETGAGKTTTALAIMQLLQKPQANITQGEIWVNGKDLTTLTEEELQKIRGKEISMIFQDPMTSLNPVLTIENQIAEIFQKHEGASKTEAVAKAHELLEMVGIPVSRGKEYQHQFSGGMKQRVVIAIALACQPELLIADEPTTALDVTIQAQVLEKMKELRAKHNTSMLLITHDLGVVAETCDTVSIMYAGCVVEHGTVEDVFLQCLHPYTKGLFDSLPIISGKQKTLKPIEGMPPDPTEELVGCPFAPRCSFASDLCFVEKPQKKHRSDSHYVACHLYDGETITESKVMSNDQ